MPNGGLITIAILLPNLLFMLWPPQPQSPPEEPGRTSRWWSGAEWLGRLAVLVLPFLCRIDVRGYPGAVAVAVMGLSLAGYYAGWGRYLWRGRHPVWLYRPMLGLRQPMAVLPTLWLLAGSVVLHSVYLAAAALVFGVAHWRVAQGEYRRAVATALPG